MPYEFFHKRFPALAKKEVRSIILASGANVISDDDLPDGEYSLFEMFCNDPGCDCRRVMFHVLTADIPSLKPAAVIAYGWESEQFYMKWFGNDDPNIAAEMMGPVLNLTSPQSRYAEQILDLINATALRDLDYIERLKRHYRMFRDAVDGETGGHNRIEWDRIDRRSADFQRKRQQRVREFTALKKRRRKKNRR